MALTPKQVSLTTSPQSLTTLLGLSTGAHIFGFDIILASGSETGYGGESDVTNVPANAGFKFTSTLGYASPQLPYQVTFTDRVYLVATAAATGLLNVWE